MRLDADGYGYLDPTYPWDVWPSLTNTMEVWWTREGWHVGLAKCTQCQWEPKRLADEDVRTLLPVQRIHTEGR